ncbi:MAG: hypothetical protein AMXMBFR64_52220 [Myxococcales bacterium]
MGLFKGIAAGFGCAGQGCGFIIGVLLFLSVLGALGRACGG